MTGGLDFRVSAYRPGRELVELRLGAPDQTHAAALAEAQGYRVVAVRPARPGGRLSWRRAPRFSVPGFAQELAGLLDAGLNVIEAVETLARKARHGGGPAVLQQVLARLREGLSFSQALEAQPLAFPTLFVATVRASEHTGSLHQALERYLAYQRQLNAVRDKVVSASVYPAVLLVAGGLVIVFLLGYVVPRFSRVFEDMGDKVPRLSRLLLTWGGFVETHALAVLASVVLLAMLAFALYCAPVRAAAAHALWGLPGLGEQLRLYHLARFMRTLGMLLQGGIPLVRALDMVDGLLRQPALHAGLQQAAGAIREGVGVSEAFGRAGLATEVGLRLLVVGERSGELGAMMERIGRLYDEDIARD